MSIRLYCCFIQIPTCNAWRNVRFSLDFPDDSCPPTNTPPRRISVIVETGSTVLDVMIAAANRNRYFNFKSSYFGEGGYLITAINGTAASIQNRCYWYWYYVIPGSGKKKSRLLVSNVVVPSNDFSVIFSYEK